VKRFASLIRDGGTVLDLACGGGRHSRYLSALGYHVVAVDIDVSGVLDLSANENVEIIEADLEAGDWPFSDRRFDGIVVTNYLHRPHLPRLVESLSPGGVLIYETFAKGNEKLGRPRNPAFLLNPAELLDAFAPRLTIMAYDDDHGVRARHRRRTDPGSAPENLRRKRFGHGVTPEALDERRRSIRQAYPVEVDMRLTNFSLVVLVGISLALNIGCSGDGGAGGDVSPDAYAGNICVGAKQAAASTFCKALFDAWATWDTDQNDGARDAAAQAAGVALGASWDAAEADAAADDASCSDLALTSSAAGSAMEAAIAAIAGSINDGLDLNENEQAQCGAALLAAASDACADVLTAESVHISDLYACRLGRLRIGLDGCDRRQLPDRRNRRGD
jgi:SAM-dependent methyltransferase